MAEVDDIKTAIGCLANVFPQYVAKELAGLADQIATAVQGFTDPLAAIGDLQVDKLLGDIQTAADHDSFGGLAGIAVGLGQQYTQRQVSDLVGSMAEEFPSVTKRVQAIRNMSGQLMTSVGLMASLYSDLPYAAVQRMCQAVVDTAATKTATLTCLSKHLTQLINSILALVKNAETYKESTILKLTDVADYLAKTNVLLGQSQRIKNGDLIFDTKVFGRAREALSTADAILAPPTLGETLLDLPVPMEFGLIPSGAISPSDEATVRLALPSLMLLIEQEINSVVGQVQVINFLIDKIGAAIDNYRAAGTSEQVKQQRNRVIGRIRKSLADVEEGVRLAVDRGAIVGASGDMLRWSSQIKSILAMMDSVKDAKLLEGSTLTSEKAAELAKGYERLIDDIRAIEGEDVVAGIEDPLKLRAQVLSLTAGAKRLLKDLENGRTDPNKLRTFHTLGLTVVTKQASRIEQSKTVASLQTVACNKFLAIEIEVGERFDDLVNSMRQLGFDRAVDMLNVGAFSDFLNTDLQMLSYVGTAIECLRHGIEATDDAQTQRQLGRMRDDLIAKRSNSEIASADSADQGRTRLIGRARLEMSELQKNAKTVESIVSSLSELLSSLGEKVDASMEGLSQFNAFLGNVDHLAVGAGGRLASTLEEWSEHPNAGVVECD